MDVEPPDDATPQSEALPERVQALHGELLRLSGRYGVSLQKLQGATVLGEAAQRALQLEDGAGAENVGADAEGVGDEGSVDAAGLPSPQAVLDWLAGIVEAWPSEVDGEILSRGLGLSGPASVGSRQERLALLAAEYNRLNQPGVGETGASGPGLDHLFTDRLLIELAWRVNEVGPEVAGGDAHGTDGPPDGVGAAQRRSGQWAWFGAAGLALVIGVVTLLWLVSQRGEDASEPSFRVVPETCSIDVCNSEATAFRGESSGFEPGEVVRVTIVTPSGVDANELGGVYGYRNELVVDGDGSFFFQYWWDPGMGVGEYLVSLEAPSLDRDLPAVFEITGS